MREKDFEREHAEPKKKNKREERERERNRSKEQKQRRERELFFLFSFASLFALVFLSIFFLSRCESSAVVKHSNAPFFSHDELVFSTSHLSLSESLSLGLSQSLGVVAQKNKF